MDLSGFRGSVGDSRRELDALVMGGACHQNWEHKKEMQEGRR